MFPINLLVPMTAYIIKPIMKSLPQEAREIPSVEKKVFTGETYKNTNCEANIINMPSQMYGFENNPRENMDFVIERQFNKYIL